MILCRVEKSKSSPGILLCGDWYDLSALWETVHHIAELYPQDGGENSQSDFLLALAFDVRKAKEHQRERVPLGIDKYDKVVYRGVKILWPIFLFQLKMLLDKKQSATASERADIERLHSEAIEALTLADEKLSKRAISAFEAFPEIPKSYLTTFVDAAVIEYLRIDKHRFSQLWEIITMLYPTSRAYTSFEEQVRKKAMELRCSIYDISLTDDEYPEIEDEGW